VDWGGEEERCINPPFQTDQESNNNQKEKSTKLERERERGDKKRRKKNWLKKYYKEEVT
jgi:hypothetical protein